MQSARNELSAVTVVEHPPAATPGGRSASDAAHRRSLRITFLSCLFPPEPAPSGVMASQLARALRLHGHDVTMIIPFPSRPQGVIYQGYRRGPRRVETCDGIRVVRCPSWLVGPKRRPWDRMLENVTFGLSSTVLEALERRPDVLMLETWPLAAAQISMWVAQLRRVPVIYYIQDLYPEVLENSGMIPKNGCLARALREWDRRLCLASEKTIVISDSMRELLLESRGLPPDRVLVVPNWIDEHEFRPLPRNNAWRREVRLAEDAFVCLYAGTLGIVSGADLLVETAHRLRNRPDILLLCVGEGVLKERMILEAKARGLPNIRFVPFQPQWRVPEMHAASDVCLLTMRKDFSNASVPSKLISYMAAARPVICAAPPDTDAAKLVRSAGAGLAVPPGDPGALADAILRVRTNVGEAAAMGVNSRRYFSEKLAFGHRYEQFEAILSEASARQVRRGGTKPQITAPM